MPDFDFTHTICKAERDDLISEFSAFKVEQRNVRSVLYEVRDLLARAKEEYDAGSGNVAFYTEVVKTMGLLDGTPA